MWNKNGNLSKTNLILYKYPFIKIYNLKSYHLFQNRRSCMKKIPSYWLRK